MTPVGTLLFNPSRLSRDDLEATLVGRDAVADRLVHDLVADSRGKTSRHWLVLAPRGFGKSHLSEVVARRLQHDHGWRVARLPEEHYQVAHLADLLEQVVVRLGGDEAGLAKLSSQEAVEDNAIDWLRALRHGHGPVLVVVENFGDLLDKLSRREAQRLREVLSRDAPFVVLATATGPSDGTTDHDAPFYDFFHTLDLDELSPDEVRALVEQHLRKDGVLDEGERRHVLGRISALYHFAGGNPRLALALYGVLREGVSEALFEQLLQLLDRVTPYYQARLRDISPQMARVLTEMSVASEKRALTPSELAVRLRLSVNQVTANVSKLEKARLVRPAGRPNARSRRYEVVDRLFRIWMQMREDRSGRQQLRFLAEFYGVVYAEQTESAWTLANDLARKYWRSAPTDDSRTARNAWLTLQHMGKALQLGDGPVAAQIVDDNRPDALGWKEISGLQKRYQRTEDDSEKGVLALRIVEAADELGFPERALPTVADALRRGVGQGLLEAWGSYLVAAMRPLGFEAKADRGSTRLSDVDVDLPADLRIARPALRVMMAIGWPTLAQTLSRASWSDDAEVRMYRWVVDPAPSDVWKVPPGNVLHRSMWAMFCHGSRAEFGWGARLAKVLIDRGYLGDFMGLAVLAQVRVALAQDAHEVEEFVAWLAETVPSWKALTWAFASRTYPWDDATRAAYRLLRKSGAFPDPIEPFESAVAVDESPNRAAALEALHPELREAIELLSARSGNTSSTVEAPPLLAAEPLPPPYGKSKKRPGRRANPE